MNRPKSLLTTVLVLALGLGVWTLAVTFTPANFEDGEVVSASELNDVINSNFDAAKEAIDGLDAFTENLTAGACPEGSAIRTVAEDGTTTCEQADAGDGVWSLTGNSGTTAGVNFLGTTDEAPLELHVNGVRALRLEPAPLNSQLPINPNLIGGFDGNSAGPGVRGATIAGGGSSGQPNQVTANYGFVGAGVDNTADGEGSAVVAGGGNTATGTSSVVVAGGSNTVGANFSAILGGVENTAGAAYSTIGGGRENQVTDEDGTVSGGRNNQAGDGDNDLTSAFGATVGGGEGNLAGSVYTTVAGGQANTASERAYATVGGGVSNSATGFGATIPGGQDNVASGDYAFAAGHSSQAVHQGAFVFTDALDTPFASTADHQFSVRASGGVRLFSSGNLSTGVTLAPGSGSWSTVSDRNAKENFSDVDPLVLLDRLADLPITTWNYIAQGEDVRHIGPAAQDFHAAFSLGESETGIATVDADGVALAAIQGLYELVQAQELRIVELERALAEKP